MKPVDILSLLALATVAAALAFVCGAALLAFLGWLVGVGVYLWGDSQ